MLLDIKFFFFFNRCYYYLGMARPIDQGMIALEKILGEEAHPDIEKAP